LGGSLAILFNGLQGCINVTNDISTWHAHLSAAAHDLRLVEIAHDTEEDPEKADEKERALEERLTVIDQDYNLEGVKFSLTQLSEFLQQHAAGIQQILEHPVMREV